MLLRKHLFSYAGITTRGATARTAGAREESLEPPYDPNHAFAPRNKRALSTSIVLMDTGTSLNFLSFIHTWLKAWTLKTFEDVNKCLNDDDAPH